MSRKLQAYTFKRNHSAIQFVFKQLFCELVCFVQSDGWNLRFELISYNTVAKPA